MYSCALVEGGAVKCWGYNAYGGLGDGTKSKSNVAVDVVGVTGATQITAGDVHSCALVASGAVKCWGYNVYGELGDGTYIDSSLAVDVLGVTGATQISAGYLNSCALIAGGAVKCWGHNAYGGLGDGTNRINSNVPVDVVGLSSATQVAAGYSHSCALVDGGAVQCWGYSGSGGLGNGTSYNNSNVPVDVLAG
jgi:alpha-tubulin suppressor-like RCC1 family protein